MSSLDTFKIEDSLMVRVFKKQKISIERGAGVYVWDEEGNRFLDFTAGWGVTSLGHSHPVVLQALIEQGKKIIQNPNSGLTYSPARANLLSVLREVLPGHLTHVFFTNSGAEANDAAIKLARKTTGRTDVVSAQGSFHGRTISTASATGQSKHRDKFNPLMPNYRFVAYNDLAELKRSLDKNVAAVILEPVQGEGGVRVPSEDYLPQVEKLCHGNGSLLIMDEIQTGFCRTGPMFMTGSLGVKADFMTMAKGIAGGFPLGAFAVSDWVSQKIQIGDHGGTYCGNPLGCAVAHAVINYLLENRIAEHVQKMGAAAMKRLSDLKAGHPDIISDTRGKGLLLLIDFHKESIATKVKDDCLDKGLLVTQTNGTGIRIFPALNIEKQELEEGLNIFEQVLALVTNKSSII
ncbi:MAG: aspartate aminotransferase family protein [Desulfobacteraceae bacterium]|nr:MAG: aspartate aminotransferase family protein [Desulfobacteraceae bacterium]